MFSAMLLLLHKKIESITVMMYFMYVFDNSSFSSISIQESETSLGIFVYLKQFRATFSFVL